MKLSFLFVLLAALFLSVAAAPAPFSDKVQVNVSQQVMRCGSVSPDVKESCWKAICNGPNSHDIVIRTANVSDLPPCGDIYTAKLLTLFLSVVHPLPDV
jgi:hypothetical protein